MCTFFSPRGDKGISLIVTREKRKVHMDEKTREHPNNTDISIVGEIPREIDFPLECEVTPLARPPPPPPPPIHPHTDTFYLPLIVGLWEGSLSRQCAFTLGRSVPS